MSRESIKRMYVEYEYKSKAAKVCLAESLIVKFSFSNNRKSPVENNPRKTAKRHLHCAHSTLLFLLSNNPTKVGALSLSYKIAWIITEWKEPEKWYHRWIVMEGNLFSQIFQEPIWKRLQKVLLVYIFL